jgi:hypothetical protein
MRINTCPACGGDTSSVRAKKRLFAQFVMKVVRCPHCRLRQSFLTRRKAAKVDLPRV